MLKAENITKIYGAGETACTALNNVSISIGDADIIAITGQSGSGKSTLINVLSGLDIPTDGKVYFNSEDITALSEKKRTDLRLKSFSFVFQDFYLISTLNVHENIILPSRYKNKKNDKEFFEKLTTECGISDKLLNYPHELSGGEQQRVAICRALLMKPDIIFADEPTGNLDSVNSGKVFELLVSYAKENSCCLVYVTHEEKYALLADRRIIVSDGKCIEAETENGHA